jgi:hypothetical protein
MAFSGTLVNTADGVTFTAVANSDTTPDFTLLGGKYSLSGYSSGTFSAQLNIKTPSGNYIAAGSAVTTIGTFDLPAGTYQIVFGASADTADGGLFRVPYRAA